MLSKTQRAKKDSFKPPSLGGRRSFVVFWDDNRPVMLPPKLQVASGMPGHPGTCPRTSLPACDPVVRTSSLSASARHTPAPAPGSRRRSQSARALRVTSPGPGINCQVARRQFHSSWLIRRAGMSGAEGQEGRGAPRARASRGRAARFPGAEVGASRR